MKLGILPGFTMPGYVEYERLSRKGRQQLDGYNTLYVTNPAAAKFHESPLELLSELNGVDINMGGQLRLVAVPSCTVGTGWLQFNWTQRSKGY